MRWLFVLVAGCGFRGPSASGGSDGAPAGEAGASDATTPTSDASMVTPDAPDPAAPFLLTGVHWLLPCSMDHDPNNTACHCTAATSSTALPATGGTRWHVAARVRGVMERMGYIGGAMDGAWYKGGMPGDLADNYYELIVSAPSAHYYLNPGSTSQSNSWSFDYTVAFDVAAGATVTFSASGQDGIQWMGVTSAGTPISIAGVTDPPQPYDGQWARLDVTAATPF